MSNRNTGFDAQSRNNVTAALGKPIPLGAVVHHVDCNYLNTSNSNLVLCQDEKYHNLLHIRTRAFKVCGHPDWRICWICKEYSPVSDLSFNRCNGQYWHSICSILYQRQRRKLKRERKT